MPANKSTNVILLIEDEKPLQLLLSQFLQRFGYKVLIASNGAEACELFAGNCWIIDLVITDCIMPKMSGIELAEKLRQHRPEIPFIFTSGYAYETVFEDKPMSKSDRFLCKPYSPAQLVATIRDVLQPAMAA